MLLFVKRDLREQYGMLSEYGNQNVSFMFFKGDILHFLHETSSTI
jgi:hypothetical protein